MRIYLDNAATTPVDKEVKEAMMPFLADTFGNPSSIHRFGREAKAAVERARRTVSDLLNTSPSELFFTSCGTEADNTALISTIESYGIKTLITSPIEHHAVLHTAQYLEKYRGIQVIYTKHLRDGQIDLEDLEEKIKAYPKSLVSLMHGNNEIGNINPIEQIANWCNETKAVFHSDTVQTIGHYHFNLQTLGPNLLAASAHKFHGPKGVGLLHINADLSIHPFLHGGAQERNMRGGTENVAGIVGMAKALELAYANLEEHNSHILGLKSYMIEELKKAVPQVKFNGLSESLEDSLPTVLNVAIPDSEMGDMLLFSLDIHNVAVSGGSACSSGTNIGSHVLEAIGATADESAIRFSFSKYNTKEEIDTVVAKMKETLSN